ncbi:MAG: four helix bundle protein [Bacteroidota bacterium]
MRLAAKEAEETRYWLELCKHSKNYPNPEGLELDIHEIIKILSSIIVSTTRRMRHTGRSYGAAKN